MSNVSKRGEGAAQKLGGKIKGGIGKLVGNERLQAKGAVQEAKGRAKEQTAKAAERVKGKVEEVGGKLRELKGQVRQRVNSR